MLTSEIPLPPFASQQQAQLFHDLVEYFLFRLDPENQRGIRETTVWSAVGRHVPQLAPPNHSQPGAHRHDRRHQFSCAACGASYPCRMTLAAAVTCRLPAPWDPIVLASALRRAGDEEWVYGKVSEGVLSWGVTEITTATRDSGGWDMSRRVKGRTAQLAEGLSNDDLSTWILAGLKKFPLPEGIEVPARWPSDIPGWVTDPPVHAEDEPAEPPSWLPGFGDDG
ncbi:hypothetical protein M6D93_16950 [Jatrophihabitans telluris]|uniref:Uncharacterized protein n=1 Tax=Jatrophihabitans telluris TaxID=2038343 RepID=A0ABY4QWF1_9ACTN|nr:hypothetical protein [Jatrophihabitans telluris]UQX87971.1 hypothetical protein M6D93_16950 [Jatrophihabitans telluris]